MVKLLIVVAAVALLLWLIFGRSRGQRGLRRDPARGDAEPMVSCAHCGVHLPRGDALAARGLHYCSAAHRDAPP
jgi:uncharacterized protein